MNQVISKYNIYFFFQVSFLYRTLINTRNKIRGIWILYLSHTSNFLCILLNPVNPPRRHNYRTKFVRQKLKVQIWVSSAWWLPHAKNHPYTSRNANSTSPHHGFKNIAELLRIHGSLCFRTGVNGRVFDVDFGAC